jgi:hypothetical protein
MRTLATRLGKLLPLSLGLVGCLGGQSGVPASVSCEEPTHAEVVELRAQLASHEGRYVGQASWLHVDTEDGEREQETVVEVELTIGASASGCQQRGRLPVQLELRTHDGKIEAQVQGSIAGSARKASVEWSSSAGSAVDASGSLLLRAGRPASLEAYVEDTILRASALTPAEAP